MNEETMILSVGIPLITLCGCGCYWYIKKRMETNVSEKTLLNINNMEKYTRLDV